MSISRCPISNMKLSLTCTVLTLFISVFVHVRYKFTGMDEYVCVGLSHMKERKDQFLKKVKSKERV